MIIVRDSNSIIDLKMLDPFNLKVSYNDLTFAIAVANSAIENLSSDK